MNEKTNEELILFFIISFLWMWAINLFRILDARNFLSLDPVISMVMGYVAVFGPGIAAFLLTYRSHGRTGIKSLWKRGWQFDFKKIWLVPTIFLIPIAAIITLGILSLLDSPIFWEAALPYAMIVPIGLLIWLFGAYPEEYGWRGYALPRLLRKYNPLLASLILGAIWGIWHLPLHFIPTTTQYVIPIWQYFLLTIVLSVLYTWLYLGTGGNLFSASLFHASGNIAGALIPYWTSNTGRWVSFLILLLPAIVIALHWQKKRILQN
ncbi:MAG TPA: type II CAAX endopeptidase family protein [Brevefilum sp.]